MTSTKLDVLVRNFISQFTSRILTKANASLFKASLYTERTDTQVIFKMNRNDVEHILSFPIPYTKNGVSLVMLNGVERAEGMYFWKAQNQMLSYLDVVYEIIFGYPVHMLPSYLYKNNITAIQQIRYAFENNTASVILHNIQKRLDFIVHGLPLHETDYNSFIMNKRITILDPEFDSISNPEEKHAYQVTKNKEYYQYGWTSLGLSDGCLADKNYILNYDLRKLTPFGVKYHNPQRNLYSTLGMRGDEYPLVQSETSAKLAETGLARKGWNLFTVFVDIPDVWEDQLMVDISHQDKYIEYEKRCICYGEVIVEVGQAINTGDALCVNKNEKVKLFKVQCDSAEVVSISDDTSNVGGLLFPTKVVLIKYRRYLKDGTKLTNMAANKGVIRLRDLGYAINPVTGKKQKIDIIVSSKAVMKRKNYTQVLEALLNTLNNNQPVVVPDSAVPTEESIMSALKDIGHREDGTWECVTYAGKFNCLAGKVFWGVTHDADDTTWKPNAAISTNARGLRDCGLKFSTIEFRALSTRFGEDNAIEKEILSYAQGFEDLRELLEILKFKTGHTSLEYITRNVNDIVPLNQETGILLTEDALKGSIVDSSLEENGFLLKLPMKYQVVLDANYAILAEGFPCEVPNELNGKAVAYKIVFDTIYVPYGNLRRCWKHDNGLIGLNDIGNALNTIVVMSKRYMAEPTVGSHISLFYSAVSGYFSLISSKLSSKSGEISIHGMSVRYPNSAKGVATLSNELPHNTIEIHKDMAKQLKVKDGDVVLVERFPCLGFTSIRPQKVQVTSDELCRFTVRASGNSLGSLSLDFDGDVLYIASFHTRGAKKALHKEFKFPNQYCYEKIQYYNKKMGTPRVLEMRLGDYGIKPFDPLTADTHAEIVSKLTGVKSNTGPVVALAYNLLRIMENSEYAGNQRLECGIEVFMDTVANSVFKQKHGVKSLHKVVTEAVCTADEQSLIAEGFDPEVSRLVCLQIKKKAKELGVADLKAYHTMIQEKGGSNIINKIVKANNVLYFTSRSTLDGCKLVMNLINYDVVDIPSKIFKKIMETKPADVREYEKVLNSIKDVELRKYCDALANSLAKSMLPINSKKFNMYEGE